MSQMSENYYMRKCYLDTATVPTQSVMKDKMGALAQVYFKSMNKKLKKLAGLEPPIKGGGKDWFIPPREVLNGRLVLKPVTNETLQRLGFNGIAFIGDWLMERHMGRMEDEKIKALLESDENWKKTIDATCRQQWEDTAKEAAAANTQAIRKAFEEFSTIYTASVNRIENILFDAAIKEIEATRNETFKNMQAHYEKLLKDQAMMLYGRYEEKLNKEKSKMKDNFIKDVEELRSNMTKEVHDIKLEKHIVVEKLRQLQESLNLACQVYVAIKEREECKKEIDLAKQKHEKRIKILKEKIEMKDFEIRLAIEKEKKCEQLNTIWQRKVCEVVKRFQMFAKYCLKEIPEHADFFINMEKLMLLQLSEVMENPTAESIIEAEDSLCNTPVARPHPFYLFCDIGSTPAVEQHLCPKHCTSSASQLPVIVVNRHLIYGACDNFNTFSDKVMEFLNGHRGEDLDFEDHHAYENDVPVKITASKQLLELKLESSLMQILQSELPNTKQVPVVCEMCNVPYCFCNNTASEEISKTLVNESPKPSLKIIPAVKLIECRGVELTHQREPKLQGYMDFVKPNRCFCKKTAKKHLKEHLPPYMQKMSTFEEPTLPHYEICSLSTLKRLVKEARGHVTPPPVDKAESKVRDVGTQYSNQEFDSLCTCFSEDEVQKLLKHLNATASISKPAFKVVGEDLSWGHLNKKSTSFGYECAHTLKKMLVEAPELEEIFKRDDCDYNVKSLK